MGKQIHGGDRYRNNVRLDFSVNINPLGIPKGIKNVFESLADKIEYYPDMECENLRQALSDKLKIPKEYFIFGNGASELFLAAVHALKPKKTVVPVPSFVGYEHALKATDCDVVYYSMDDYVLDEDVIKFLDDNTDLLILANPNNPTGKYIELSLLERILNHCKENKITVILDECFMELSDDCEQNSIIGKINKWPNVLLVRAFTKTYAVPGVRLGYLISSNPEMLRSIKKHIPEWNTSVIAQQVSVEAIKEEDYLEEAIKFIKTERTYLEKELKKMGCVVVESNTTFLFFRIPDIEVDLYEKMLSCGILIRDCKNFMGTEKGCYRIAVKKHEDNVKFVNVMRQFL